jgi:prepilin-type N-terminal cleavage/methylation domain-containing protein
MKKQAGFTLIEIAIVLVIIGLLLGGVLKGQEMITNSKIKRTSNDYNGVAAAIYSYLDRYSAMPGDDPNANGRWSIVDGDGDGQIDGAEQPDVWEHLRASGLVAGTGVTAPNHAFGGRISVRDNQGGATGLNGTVICMADMPGKIGEILDRQLDDCDPSAGEFRLTGGGVKYDQLADAIEVCKKL